MVTTTARAARFRRRTLSPTHTDEQLGRNHLVGQLKEKFDAAGLGDTVDSWISTGENQSISADEVKQVMDPTKLQVIADDAGIDVDTAAANVAESLPQLVDKLTPTGAIPGA